MTAAIEGSPSLKADEVVHDANLELDRSSVQKSVGPLLRQLGLLHTWLGRRCSTSATQRLRSIDKSWS